MRSSRMEGLGRGREEGEGWGIHTGSGWNEEINCKEFKEDCLTFLYKCLDSIHMHYTTVN